jgi:tetratricopeptide (TPR) repeat protein
MYLPSIGLFVMAAWGGAETLEVLRSRFGRTHVAIGAIAAALVALAVTAWSQTGHWRSSMALFEHALEVVPRNPTIRYNVANRLRDRGKLDDAIALYQIALRIEPDYAAAHGNLASALRAQNKREQALHHYRRALEIDPGDVESRRGLRALGGLDEESAPLER